MHELLGLILVLVRLAVAIEPLTITTWTTLDVTALNVQFSLDRGAVMARASVRTPII